MITAEDYLWYVDEALDGMVAIVTELGDDLANRRPDVPDTNSPYVLLHHCLGVMEYWGGHVVAGRSIERDPEALLIAEVDGRLAGTLVVGWDGWRCHLYRLAVDPGRRRDGIGRALITAAENRIRSLGGTRIDAMVLDDNPGAHAIWAAGGYHRQEDWSRWVKPF